MNTVRLTLHAAAMLLCSCAAPQLEIKRAEVVKPGQHPSLPMFDWQGDQVTGPVSMTISLSEQKAHIFRGGKQVGWTYVATGKPSHPSPRGTYRILEKIADKHSNKYGMIVNASGSIIDRDATAGRESNLSRFEPLSYKFATRH